jgi:RNA polymerase sigma-70 factor, ECF subfamily
LAGRLGVAIQTRTLLFEPTPDRQTAQTAIADRLALLLAAYQSGNVGAANQFAEALQPILTRHFYMRTGNHALAQDLAQECWMRIHHARASFRAGDPVLPWVFAIARYTRADHYRRAGAGKRSAPESRALELAEPSHDARPAMEQSLMAGQVIERLRELPEAQREVFLMMKVHGLSVEETARAVGITPAAAKQKAYRAYEQIRSMFGRGKGDAAK